MVKYFRVLELDHHTLRYHKPPHTTYLPSFHQQQPVYEITTPPNDDTCAIRVYMLGRRTENQQNCSSIHNNYPQQKLKAICENFEIEKLLLRRIEEPL